MDIKEFVNEIMRQISECVKNEKETGGWTSGDVYLHSDVDFDLAVVVSLKTSSKSSTESKADIKIVGASANGESSMTTNSEVVSRVKFSMGLIN